jgi:hypothetical protein
MVPNSDGAEANFAPEAVQPARENKSVCCKARGGKQCVTLIGTDVAGVSAGDYRPIPTERNDIMRDTWT